MSRVLFIGGVCLVLAFLYAIGDAIYNVFFHPLRNYPGPLLWRATRLSFCHKIATGTIPFDVHALHQKYGRIVRIAPDHLAFADPQAWKDIMGHHHQGSDEMAKYEKYYSPIAGTPVTLINAPREFHGQMRRALAHGFSEKRIREQEDIIEKYINLLMSRLTEVGGGEGAVALDMVAWFNFALFDVIGDLTFGEPFGCLQDSEYHPWIRSFFAMARSGSYLYAMAWWPMLQKALMFMTPPRVWIEQIQLYTQSVKKLKKRMEFEGKRPDLVQCFLDNKEKLNLDIAALEANSTLLVVAGAETTATLLSGVTYLLLKNPETLKKLREEVRESFKSEDEITFNSTNNLPYLKACIDEALRLYPPTAGGLPRRVPEGGATIAGSYVPEKTVVSIYHYAMGRSEELWTSASEFHPERFLDDPRFAKDKADSIQPFHLGPRSCLGRNLANLEMRIILARLIWRFDLKLAPSSEEWMEGQQVFDVWGKPPLNVYLTSVSR